MTDADLELCERAARAVGVQTKRWPQGLFVVSDPHDICPTSITFTPLENRGQANRIAEHLGMISKTCPWQHLELFERFHREAFEADLTPDKARMRAIVRVAAEVGS